METESVVIPEKYKVLSGSALKCIALVTMIIDHIAVVLLKDSRIILFGAGHFVEVFKQLEVLGNVDRQVHWLEDGRPAFSFLATRFLVMQSHNKIKYYTQR